jgi:branched-chain amino acid transport system permease protein
MDFGGTFLQVLVGGLATGSIFGLVGLGLVLILNTTSIANFSQGEMGLVATFISFSALNSFGFPAPVAALACLVIGIASAALMGVLTDRLLVQRIADQPLMNVAVLTLGLFFILHSSIEIVWGPQPRVFPALFGSGVIAIGSAMISSQQLGIFIISLVVALALAAWMRLSRSGAATRAVVQNPLGAALSGVPMKRMRYLMWAVGVGLAGLAGVLIAPVLYLNENMMGEIIVQAFAAATLGGLNSLSGTFIGGLLLGIIQSFASVYVSGSLATAISLVVIVVVLVVRPSGLIGQTNVSRV